MLCRRKCSNHADRDELLVLCREKAKADHFMIINHYKEDAPQDFLKTAVENCRVGIMKVLDYDIYVKRLS